MSHQKNAIPASALLTKPIVESDESIEHYAKQFTKSAKLKSRMSFAEFMTMPDDYIKRMVNWPEVVWDISFTDAGSHQKMWIDDTVEGKTINVFIIRGGEPQSVVDRLYTAAGIHGFPDECIVPTCDTYNASAARAWLRLNNIAHSTAKQKRSAPQVMGSFEHEAVA